MKIGLEMINTQKEVTVEVLLDSSIIELVMSLEFARKQEFKLKKIIIFITRDIGRGQKSENRNRAYVRIAKLGHKFFLISFLF